MRLQELMNTKVETISPETTARQAWIRMDQKGIHHLVVMSNHAVMGIVSL